MKQVKVLNLNDPNDARAFIKEAMPECLDGANIDYFDLKDGTRISTKNLTDSQAVQYAFELLPIYQAKFPEMVNVQMEH